MTLRDLIKHVGHGAVMEITVCEWHGDDYDVETYLIEQLPTDYLDRLLIEYTIYCGNIVVDIMAKKGVK